VHQGHQDVWTEDDAVLLRQVALLADVSEKVEIVELPALRRFFPKADQPHVQEPR
jgi:hypothetical protein